MKLSVVIPCYNEAKNIPFLLERLSTVVKRNDIEIVLVDNGSTDETESVLSHLLPAHPFVKIVNVSINQGYGYGILSGLRESTGEYIGWTHADLQTDPQDAIKALDIIETMHYPENVYVKGSRKRRPLFDLFFTLGMSLFETAYLKTMLWDINAQPNIFHRSFFESWTSPPHDFALDLYALYRARRQHVDIVRFPVLFLPRQHGHSHWNTSLSAKWRFIKRTLQFSREMKRGLTKSNS